MSECRTFDRLTFAWASLVVRSLRVLGYIGFVRRQVALEPTSHLVLNSCAESRDTCDGGLPGLRKARIRLRLARRIFRSLVQRSIAEHS